MGSVVRRLMGPLVRRSLGAPLPVAAVLLAAAPLLSAAGGCVHPLPEPGQGPDLSAWSGAVDWEAAGDEAARVLAGYLQVDTFNPPGNETRGARYLAAVLAREGIASEIVEFAPGRGSLIARLRASTSKQRPLCLLSHIDVATADASKWPAGRGPLSGAIDDQGQLWGRGALDMKGMGVLELMTLVWLKRLQVPLTRDVILLAVADEEVGGGGMRHVVDRHWGRIRCSHLVNEGGLGLRDVLFEGHTVFGVSVAEKGVLWLRMVVRGRGGHGSTPYPDQTPRVLLRALNRLERREPEGRLHPSLFELFARVGAQRGGLSGFVLRRPALVRAVVKGKLMARPGTRAALIDTVNVTGISTGDRQPNVVSTEAAVLLDCRLLPGTRPEQVIAELRQLVDDPRVRFEVIQTSPALVSTWDDPLFRALTRHAVAGRDDAAAGPVLSPGFTDSMYARRRGVRAYGLIPFEVTEAEAKTMHAPRERVSIKNVREGLRILFSAVVEVSADLGRRPPRRRRRIRPPARQPLDGRRFNRAPLPASPPLPASAPAAPAATSRPTR
jgi:acetylornithine deacetylase/succinyl-diaminopimelate desuccinylase-like protein